MNRGDVYYADLSPAIGNAAKKRRPCLIVSNDANNRAAGISTQQPVGAPLTSLSRTTMRMVEDALRLHLGI